MKKGLTFILFAFLNSVFAFGNINHINFEKIENYRENLDRIEFIVNHQQYYNQWSAEWNYDIKKKQLVKTLEKDYATFSKLNFDTTELNLLLGDISHFLYNLDQEQYLERAINHYNLAIETSPEDYRPLWFLANHYSQSANPNEAIAYFLKAQKLLPDKAPADFWEEYAYSTAIANMPSNSIFAMDKARKILGEPCNFETLLGENIRNRITDVDKDEPMKNTDLWNYSDGDLIIFTSRPLGVKLLIDSTWNINFHDYNNRIAAVTIAPPPFKNKEGREINFTILLLAKVAEENESFNEYIEALSMNSPDRINSEFTDKYEKYISYELIDETLYEDIGGAHMHVVGIERDSPEYPGLVLEMPQTIGFGNVKRISYYSSPDSKNRFEGKIFYALLLDTCEDIYIDSFALYKEFFENRVIIE